jgi:hypothetical protein
MSTSFICLILFQIYDCNQIWHMATFAHVKESFQKQPTLFRNNSLLKIFFCMCVCTC